MNKVFQPYLRNYVAVFFDDILLYSRSLEEHTKHLGTVFSTLKSHCFFAKFLNVFSHRRMWSTWAIL